MSDVDKSSVKHRLRWSSGIHKTTDTLVTLINGPYCIPRQSLDAQCATDNVYIIYLYSLLH